MNSSAVLSYSSQYFQWADRVEEQLLEWGDGSGKYKFSPMQEYPLAKLSSALAILGLYIALVVVGTVIMRYTKIPAINIRALQFLYNPLQVALCSYMCIETGILAYRNNYSFVCPNFNAAKPVMGNVLWLFYLSKVLDFCDTIFIILSKKWKQLTFLHAYHHCSIFAVYWLNFRVAYDGDIYLTIVLNGAIHLIMYMYYFVSSHTKDIWWKKYLTTMQIIQFCCMNLQAIILMQTGCSQFPPNIVKFYFGYIQTLLWLFINFYLASYVQKTRFSSKDKLKDL